MASNPVWANGVWDTSTTTGTGTYTLSGTAVVGRQTFGTGVGNGNSCYYRAEDDSGGGWEEGIGTYTASGTTLSRDTILASSNSGSAVNWSAGTRQIFLAEPSIFAASGLYVKNKTGTYTMNTGESVYGDASGGAFTVTLPPATGSGQLCELSKFDTSGNAVNGVTGGSDKVYGLASGGVTSFSIRGEGDSYTFRDIGTNKWKVVDSFLSPSFFSGYQANAQTLALGWNAITIDTVAAGNDPDSLHVSSSSPYAQIKKTGLYQLEGGCYGLSLAGVLFGPALWKGVVGSGVQLGTFAMVIAGGNAALPAGGELIQLSNGDEIGLGIYLNSSAAPATLPNFSYLRLNRVGG